MVAGRIQDERSEAEIFWIVKNGLKITVFLQEVLS